MDVNDFLLKSRNSLLISEFPIAMGIQGFKANSYVPTSVGVDGDCSCHGFSGLGFGSPLYNGYPSICGSFVRRSSSSSDGRR